MSAFPQTQVQPGTPTPASSFFNNPLLEEKQSTNTQENPLKTTEQQVNLSDLKTNIESTISKIRTQYDLNDIAKQNASLEDNQTVKEAYALIDSLQKDILSYIKGLLAQGNATHKNELLNFKKLFSKAVTSFEFIKESLANSSA